MKRADMTPEQRARINKQNAKARNAYNAKAYINFTVRIKADGSDGITPEAIRHAAEQAGLSVNAWTLEAIRDKL